MSGVANWFDGEVPCPECGHKHDTYCACINSLGRVMQAPNQCLCANEAHFTGNVAVEQEANE